MAWGSWTAQRRPSLGTGPGGGDFMGRGTPSPNGGQRLLCTWARSRRSRAKNNQRLGWPPALARPTLPRGQLQLRQARGDISGTLSPLTARPRPGEFQDVALKEVGVGSGLVLPPPRRVQGRWAGALTPSPFSPAGFQPRTARWGSKCNPQPAAPGPPPSSAGWGSPCVPTWPPHVPARPITQPRGPNLSSLSPTPRPLSWDSEEVSTGLGVKYGGDGTPKSGQA